ncbi:MAG TPA: methyltransferase [Streptosporangiaceae bacterium]
MPDISWIAGPAGGDDLDLTARLRASLLDAGYTVAGVRDRLGAVAGGALAREEIVPALPLTADGDPLSTAIRLWWLQIPVDTAPVRAAYGDPAADALLDTGLLVHCGDQVRAAVRIQPWEPEAGGHGGYIASDPVARPGDAPPAADHVVGTGGASASLARIVHREPVDSALDLGTGCGVQALHLASRTGAITATDVNRRALDLARLSFALSEVANVETRHGSLFEPVREERFDLVVSNPPFVVGPNGRYTYRESGLPGDEVCRALVERAPAHLNPGGRCHLLGNWLHVRGDDWRDRVGGWLARTGCDGWVVQRDVRDPAEYVELWLRDSVETGTPRYRELYEEWLAWFAANDVEGVGFGWITLHASGAPDPVVRVEELIHQVEEPVGAYVTDVLAGIGDAHRMGDAELLAATLRTAPGVVQEYHGPPGFTDPERIVLRQGGGLRRARAVDTVTAALAGVCDGSLPVGPLLAAIAELTGESGDDLRKSAPEVLRSLIAEGFFVPPSLGGDV